MIQDRAGDKQFHMFVSEFAGSCGLNSWSQASQIVHAVAATPAGPFERREVLLGNFSHNPVINYDKKTRQYVMHHIGCGTRNPNKIMECQCQGGHTLSAADCGQAQTLSCSSDTTHVMNSSRLNGPWTSRNVTVVKNGDGVPPKMGKFQGALFFLSQLVELAVVTVSAFESAVDNPTPWFEDDGSITMLGRCDFEAVGSISASALGSDYILGSQVGGPDSGTWPGKWNRWSTQHKAMQ